MPMHVDHEIGFDPEILAGLKALGHRLFEAPPNSGFTSLTAIGRTGNKLSAVFDPRREGSAEVF